MVIDDEIRNARLTGLIIGTFFGLGIAAAWWCIVAQAF